MKTGAADVRGLLAGFCRERRLPAAFAQDGQRYLWPLAQWIAGVQRLQGRCLVVGINGAQGTGKSTIAAVLAQLLGLTGLRMAVLSIDDLYLPRARRLALAAAVHPLLATRGVPGTHEVELGIAVLQRLRTLAAQGSCRLPRFDKLADDRLPMAQWPEIDGPVDVVLFEGWCVGTPAQSAAELAQPVNALEAEEDADSRWRRWVNDRLREDYPRLFALVDRLVFLRTPDFEHVVSWRRQQENELAHAAGSATSMDADALQRFIRHYERLTRHALATLPGLADVCVQIGPDHGIAGVRYRDPPGAERGQDGQVGVPPPSS